jgi:cytochrome c-type biogenesis protein CcmH/NrfG
VGFFSHFNQELFDNVEHLIELDASDLHSTEVLVQRTVNNVVRTQSLFQQRWQPAHDTCSEQVVSTDRSSYSERGGRQWWLWFAVMVVAAVLIVATVMVVVWQTVKKQCR